MVTGRTRVTDIGDTRLHELMESNYTLMRGISRGDRIEVVADHATYEGRFKGVLVNQHDGLVLLFTHTRTNHDGDEVKCETSLSGSMVRQLTRLDGPAPDPDKDTAIPDGSDK